MDALRRVVLPDVPQLIRCGWFCVDVEFLSVGHLFPTKTELDEEPENFEGRRLAFASAACALLLLALATLEGLAAAWRACDRKRASSLQISASGESATSLATSRSPGPLRSRSLEGSEQQALLSREESMVAIAASGAMDVDEFQNISTFAAFVCLYHASCWAAAGGCIVFGVVSVSFGLWWEIYWLWLACIMLLHIGCLISRYQRGRSPPLLGACSQSVLKSVTPTMSEPLDGLRDPVMCAVYAMGGSIGIVPAILTVLGCVLPFHFILRDKNAFYELRKSYWPILSQPDQKVEDPGHDASAEINERELDARLPQRSSRRSRRKSDPSADIHVEAEASGAVEKIRRLTAAVNTLVEPLLIPAQDKLLNAAKEQTDPLKQYIVLYEEIPQAAAAFVFGLAGGASVLSLLSGCISIAKVLMVTFCRPLVLGFCAKKQKPWSGVSARDIDNAMKSNIVASLSERSLALVNLLYEEHGKLEEDVVLMALKWMQTSLQDVARRDAQGDHWLWVLPSIGQAAKLLNHQAFSVKDAAEKVLKASPLSLRDPEQHDFWSSLADASRGCHLSAAPSKRRESLRTLLDAEGFSAPFARDVYASLRRENDQDAWKMALKVLLQCGPGAIPVLEDLEEDPIRSHTYFGSDGIPDASTWTADLRGTSWAFEKDMWMKLCTPPLWYSDGIVDGRLSFIKHGGGAGLEPSSVLGEGLKYSGIARGPDGLLYCSPFDSSKVLIIDPSTQKLEFIDGAGEEHGKYGGIALGSDGLLYCAPFCSEKVLVIHPKERRLSFIEGAGNAAEKFLGIAEADDGRLFCAPSNSSKVLIIDPQEKKLSYIDGAGSGVEKYHGIARGKDGLLYCAPLKASKVLIICPQTETLGDIEVPGTKNEYSYAGITNGPDGRLYCAPSGASRVLVIDPPTKSVEFIGDAVGDEVSKYNGIAAGPNGVVYCCPNKASHVLAIDTKAQNVSFIKGAGSDSSKFSGIVMGRDNLMYCSPKRSAKVLVLNQELRADTSTVLAV
eukprot:TRINITY_DN8659_c0_g1_i2.p1 TRINITY_DN8659_c0_g1~~TRINITY_DN8659_c0_g1_i2.p1  ORF type:complete len:1008 (-),score=153.72 TRINITY_DN8659_c0_g1_i2:555-3578(-)